MSAYQLITMSHKTKRKVKLTSLLNSYLATNSRKIIHMFLFILLVCKTVNSFVSFVCLFSEASYICIIALCVCYSFHQFYFQILLSSFFYHNFSLKSGGKVIEDLISITILASLPIPPKMAINDYN